MLESGGAQVTEIHAAGGGSGAASYLASSARSPGPNCTSRLKMLFYQSFRLTHLDSVPLQRQWRGYGPACHAFEAVLWNHPAASTNQAVNSAHVLLALELSRRDGNGRMVIT